MQISDKTTIPLSFLWAFGAATVGAIMWLTTIFVQGNASAAEIKELKAEVKILYAIDKRLERIEDKLGIDSK